MGRWSFSVRRPRFSGLLLPGVSALLLLLAFPPFQLLLPSFVALVPFDLHLRRLPPGAGGGRRAFRAGAVLGGIHFALLLHWLIPALVWITPAGAFLYLAVVGILAVILGGVGWAAHGLGSRTGVPSWLALALAWTAGEWLRAHLPGGLAFPWLGLGASLTDFPDLIGLAELVGARGLGFWIVLVNGVLTEWVWLASSGRGRTTPPSLASAGASAAPVRFGAPARAAAALALLVAVPVAWSVWRARTLEIRPVARVAAARTMIPVEVKLDPESAVEHTRDQLREIGFGREPSAIPPADLLVWPETTFPVPFSPRVTGGEAPSTREARAFVEEVSRREGAPVLVGAFGTGDGGDAGRRPDARFNSAFLLDASGFRFGYHKRFLVPLVERAPLLLPGGSRLADRRGGLAAGGEWPVADFVRPVADFGVESPTGAGDGTADSASSASSASFGVVICWESAFPSAARAYRAQGADFLVNLTNDAWFGTGSWLPSAAGLRQHPAHLVLRAVENRMGVVRSANGGSSHFVDPLGRVHGRADDERPSVTVDAVTTSDVRTLYTRTGDLAGPGALLTTVVLLTLSLLSPGARGVA